MIKKKEKDIIRASDKATIKVFNTEFTIIYPSWLDMPDMTYLIENKELENYQDSQRLDRQVYLILKEWTPLIAKCIGYSDRIEEPDINRRTRTIFFKYVFNNNKYCTAIMITLPGVDFGYTTRFVEAYYISKKINKNLKSGDFVPILIDGNNPKRVIFFDFKKRLNTFLLNFPCKWHDIDRINFDLGVRSKKEMDAVEKWYAYRETRKLMSLGEDLLKE